MVPDSVVLLLNHECSTWENHYTIIAAWLVNTKRLVGRGGTCIAVVAFAGAY